MCDDPRCSAHLQTPAQRLAQLAMQIGRSGWALVGNLPSPEHPAGYAYTVGMTPRGLPELLMDGDPEHVRTPLGDLVDALLLTPDAFVDGNHVRVITPGGDPFTVRLAGPTEALTRRACLAVELYASRHTLRVMEVATAMVALPNTAG